MIKLQNQKSTRRIHTACTRPRTYMKSENKRRLATSPRRTPQSHTARRGASLKGNRFLEDYGEYACSRRADIDREARALSFPHRRWFQLCIRGRTHIFKYLERQAAKHERARGGRTRRTPLDMRGHATLDTRSHRRHNVDSGYSTSDGVDKRWSQEIHSAVSFAVALLALPLSLHLLHLLSSYFYDRLFGQPTAAEPSADLWSGSKCR